MSRLFFALWPDAAALGRLEAERARLVEISAGRPTPSEKIHLTVHFLGSVDESRVEALNALAAGMRSVAPVIRLDQAGSFRQAKAAWAGCASPAADLAALHDELGQALSREGFATEARAYAPHLTLARKIQRRVATMPIDAIEWPAQELTLVKSELGTGRYTTLARWQLD